MSPPNQTVAAVPALGSIAIAGLLGAMILAVSPTMARAASSTPAPNQSAQAPLHQTAGKTMDNRSATVARRIASLHRELKITPDEEADWKNVAEAMRDNAAAMDKLVEERNAQDPRTMTAVADLKAYENIVRAHADGLETLTSSFETLYNSMPKSQQRLADQVFRNVHRNGGRPQS